MKFIHQSLPSFLSLFLSLGAIGSVASCGLTGGAETGVVGEKLPPGTVNRELSEGYSLLHTNVKGMGKVDKAFWVKVEHDDVQKVVTDMSDYCDGLAAELEEMADVSPDVRLDLSPLPELEQRKLDAVQSDRLKSFAPFVGRTGTDFERTLLLTLSGGLNQQRHLTEVLADADSSPARSEQMKRASTDFDALYERVVSLLNEKYFIDERK